MKVKSIESERSEGNTVDKQPPQTRPIFDFGGEELPAFHSRSCPWNSDESIYGSLLGSDIYGWASARDVFFPC